MKRHVLSIGVVAMLASSALAQEAPPPRKMPRVPVHRESIQDHRVAVPATREVEGAATIIDGEKLHVGDFDIRLFGIVPPQLSASFGPQARAALDELTAGQKVTCLVRDRDREGRLLATCHNAKNADLALELLRRGLAVSARGSIASTELATPYLAAEQAAVAQRLGLWSVAVPAAAIISETPKVEAAAMPVPVSAHEKAAEKPEEKTPAALAKSEPAIASFSPLSVTNPAPISADPGFVARYQLLVTGLVMLLTALGLFGAVAIQRLRERRLDMKALAAALRGELMAAHAICRARLRSTVGAEDKDISWPRLRSTLYNAYVGRLGWLGAELARHIASIYGQASDYAAYYAGNDESRIAAMPKRQALQHLIQHIDEVLPRLAAIEHTGKLSGLPVSSPHPPAVVVPLATPTVQLPATTSSVAQVPSTNVQATVRRVPMKFASAQLWAAMQKLVRMSWSRKKAAQARDPIAEYTALIEEEMKRFSYVEDEDESESLTASSSDTWPPQTAHEAF